jgi:phosphate transport system protein
MRNVFHRRLDALSGSVADLCELSGSAMAQATQALLDADIVLAEAVIGAHDDLMLRANQAENDAYRLLVLRARVAGDSRAVMRILQNVAEVYRMAGLALHVADTVRLRHPGSAIPDELRIRFAEMGRIAVDLSRDAAEAVLSGDVEQAAKLAYDDEAMDELHEMLFTFVVGRQWTHATTAVDVTLLSRYYERFADHAVTVGQRIVVQTTGTSVTQYQLEHDRTA